MLLALSFLIKFASLTALSQELPQGLDKMVLQSKPGTSLIKIEEISILKEKLEEDKADDEMDTKAMVNGPSNLDILSQLEEENGIKSDLLNTVDESFLLEESSVAGDPSPLGENWGTLRDEMNDPGFSVFAPVGNGESSGDNDTAVNIDWATTQIKGSVPDSSDSSSSFPTIPD